MITGSLSPQPNHPLHWWDFGSTAQLSFELCMWNLLSKKHLQNNAFSSTPSGFFKGDIYIYIWAYKEIYEYISTYVERETYTCI